MGSVPLKIPRIRLYFSLCSVSCMHDNRIISFLFLSNSYQSYAFPYIVWFSAGLRCISTEYFILKAIYSSFNILFWFVYPLIFNFQKCTQQVLVLYMYMCIYITDKQGLDYTCIGAHSYCAIYFLFSVTDYDQVMVMKWDTINMIKLILFSQMLTLINIMNANHCIFFSVS